MSLEHSDQLLNQLVNRLHNAHLLSYNEKDSLKAQINALPNPTQSASALIKLVKEQVLTYTNKTNGLIDLAIIMQTLNLSDNHDVLVEALCEFTSLREDYKYSMNHCKKMYALVIERFATADTLISDWEVIQKIKATGSCDTIDKSLLTKLQQHAPDLFFNHPDADDNYVTYLVSIDKSAIIDVLVQLDKNKLLNSNVREFLNQNLIKDLKSLNKVFSQYPNFFKSEQIESQLKRLSKHKSPLEGAKNLTLLWEAKDIPTEFKPIYEKHLNERSFEQKTTFFMLVHEAVKEQFTQEDALIICHALNQHRYRVIATNESKNIIRFYKDELYTPSTKSQFLTYLSNTAQQTEAMNTLKKIKKYLINDVQQLTSILGAHSITNTTNAFVNIKKQKNLEKKLIEYYNQFPLRAIDQTTLEHYQQQFPDYILPNQKQLQHLLFAEAQDIRFSADELSSFNALLTTAQKAPLGINYLYNKLSKMYYAEHFSTILNLLITSRLFAKNSIDYLFSLNHRTKNNHFEYFARSFEKLVQYDSQNTHFNFCHAQAYFQFLIDREMPINEKNNLSALLNSVDKDVAVRLVERLEQLHILLDNQVCIPIINRVPRDVKNAAFFDALLDICSTAHYTLEQKIQLCRNHMREYLDIPLPQAQNQIINYAQSVHNQAVTETAYKSAYNLATLYEKKCPDINAVKQGLLSHTKQYLETKKAQIVQRCLQRITTHELTFTIKEISIKKLLLLNWAAVHEQDKTLLHEGVTLDAAKDALVKGLYEIQRAYNLNELDIDNESPNDQPSCTEGSFNILAGCLRTIHKSVEIHLITQKQASDKFQQLIKKEVKLYLQQQKNQLDEIEFMKFLESLKKDGIQSIWQIIENSIETAMINEFGSLYDNKKEHTKFREIMDNYIDVDIDAILDSYYTLSQSTDIDAEINESNEPIGYNHLSNSASSSASSSGLKHARSLSDNEENEEHLVKRSNNIRVAQSSSSSSSSSSGLKHSRTIDSDGEEENNEEPVLKRVKNTLSTQNPFRLFANNAQNNNAFSDTMEHEDLDSEDEHSIHQNAAT